MSSSEKLQSIFKIYNRKDMVEKLKSLRKNTQNEKMKTTQYQSSELGENSFKDYDYESNSMYLAKLERSKGTKFNTSLYNPKIKEMAEVEPHLEATPNNSTKKIRLSSENPEFHKTQSMGSFHKAVEKCQHHKSLDTKHKSSHNLKSRRMINVYNQRDNGIKCFRPMKEERVAHVLMQSNNPRYLSIDDTQD
jgi:hypothetical protein